MCVVLPIEEQDLGGSSSPVPVTEPQPDLDDQAADKTDHDAVMSSDDRYTNPGNKPAGTKAVATDFDEVAPCDLVSADDPGESLLAP